MPKETFLKLPEEKKNKIIKAAKKEFERVPFEQTSIKNIVEDAEIAIVCMNSTAGTTKAVVDSLRAQGIKAGLLKIRMFRPFPSEEVAQVLSKLKAVAVLDKSDSLNGAGGALFEDVVSGMYIAKSQVPVVNYVYGIGGRDTTAKDIESVFSDLSEIAKTGNIENPYRYLGVRK